MGLAAAVAAVWSSSARAADAVARPDLVTAEAEQAIQRGLACLARTQNRDGSWRSGQQEGGYPVAMTALAGLALMAGGSTPGQGEYADHVRRAVDFLLKSANRNGLIAAMSEEMRPMHGHGFAMLFLAEAYGAEEDTDLQRDIYRVLSRAVMLTARSQSADGGWLYKPDQNGDEGSVTVTQIQGLRACRNAGIKVPRSTITRACEYISRCANPDGGISYSVRNVGQSRPPITAAAVATLYNAGEYEHPVALRALDYLRKHCLAARGGDPFGGHRFYMLLYLSQAMYLSGEADWREFFPRHRDELLRSQNKDGSWTGDFVGETYGTAIALVVLQLPYRYLPILQR
jgi:hypothetical protein